MNLDEIEVGMTVRDASGQPRTVTAVNGKGPPTEPFAVMLEDSMHAHYNHEKLSPWPYQVGDLVLVYEAPGRSDESRGPIHDKKPLQGNNPIDPWSQKKQHVGKVFMIRKEPDHEGDATLVGPEKCFPVQWLRLVERAPQVEVVAPRPGRVPLSPDEFHECATCAVKTGAPVLCAACLHNRRLEGALRSERETVRKVVVERDDNAAKHGAAREHVKLLEARVSVLRGQYDNAMNGRRDALTAEQEKVKALEQGIAELRAAAINATLQVDATPVLHVLPNQAVETADGWQVWNRTGAPGIVRFQRSLDPPSPTLLARSWRLVGRQARTLLDWLQAAGTMATRGAALVLILGLLVLLSPVLAVGALRLGLGQVPGLVRRGLPFLRVAGRALVGLLAVLGIAALAYGAARSEMFRDVRGVAPVDSGVF